MAPTIKTIAVFCCLTLAGCAGNPHGRNTSATCPDPAAPHAGMQHEGGMMHGQGGMMRGAGANMMHSPEQMHCMPGGMDPQRHMEQLDMDGDGDISRDEFNRFHGEHFEKMDRDGDGRLEPDEMPMAK